MDKRTEYIVACASTLLGVGANATGGESAIADFLESPTARVLQAYPKDGSLAFSTTASLSREIPTAVIFTKQGSAPLTEGNIASALLMSKVSNPLETLQLALTELYGPVLLQSGQARPPPARAVAPTCPLAARTVPNRAPSHPHTPRVPLHPSAGLR